MIHFKLNCKLFANNFTKTINIKIFRLSSTFKEACFLSVDFHLSKFSRRFMNINFAGQIDDSK